jgi:transcriptional regulator with XRE-family HTH domain
VNEYDAFCAQLGAAIKSSSLSRNELAEQLAVKPATIKSWLSGRRSPTVKRVLDLARALEIRPVELFAEPATLPDHTSCEVCGDRFSHRGYRIHAGLRARTCSEHARLLEPEQSPCRAADIVLSAHEVAGEERRGSA